MRVERMRLLREVGLITFISAANFGYAASSISAQAETGKPPVKAAAPAGKQVTGGMAPEAAVKLTTQLGATIKEAQVAELGGQDALAGEKYRAALKQAQDSPASKDVAPALIAADTALADFLYRQNQLAEQLSYRQDALNTAEKFYGKGSTQYAEQAANLGTYHGSKGEGGESRRLVDQAIAILKNDEAHYPLELATCYMATARRQCAEGTFGLADDSYIKARQLRDSKGTKGDVVGLLYCLEHARLLDKIDRKAEAKQLKERIISYLALNSTAGGGTTAKSGKEGQSPFAKFVAQAKSAESSKENDKAIELWKLAANETDKPGQESKYAYALVHLGDQYRLKKETAQAIAAYKKALEAREKAGATESLGMCRNLERLGQAYLQEQRYAEAKDPLTRALDIEKKVSADLGIQASAMQHLMTAHLTTKNNSAAESVAKQILDLPDTAGSAIAMKKQTAKATLGSIYMQTGRMQEGMAIMQQIVPPNASAGADMMKAFQSEYTRTEKIFDDAEEKALGL